MLTALFDGNCIVCQSTRRTITALDWRHRVNFVDFHDRDAWQSQYPQLNIKNMMGEIHVIDEDDNVYTGIYATRRMLRELPLGWPLWLLLHLPAWKRWAPLCTDSSRAAATGSIACLASHCPAAITVDASILVEKTRILAYLSLVTQ